MFKKLLICLTQPAKIGMYIFEKRRFSIIMLLVLLLIATIPYGIMIIANENRLYSESVDAIEQTFMQNGLDYELAIKDGLLTGEEGIAVGTTDVILFINPNQEKNPYAMYSSGIPTIEFKETTIVGTFSGLTVFNHTYAEVGLENFDFNDLMNVDYIAFHKFIGFVESLTVKFLAYTAVMDILATILQMFSLMLASAAIMALIVKLFHQFLPYRLRFKLALDSQVITVFAILLSFLFNQIHIITIGLFLSSMYLLRSLRSIVRVEVKKTPKDGEE